MRYYQNTISGEIVSEDEYSYAAAQPGSWVQYNKMRNNDTLGPLVATLSLLRKIYTSAEINEFGDAIILNKVYPDFLKELLAEIGTLERVIASSIKSPQKG